ncbi:acid-sensing ion channel 2-like [Clytia hemisphaerica]|uniref:acid-sensing ion channel 2-like n=1 Tax=Clytia hemisphaerica TaxID=252671 RepID=UPI0034D65621
MMEPLNLQENIENESESNRQNRIREERKKLFQEFCGSVTLHGFRFIFEEKHIRRFIWLLITTGIFLLSIILFFEILQDFLEYKTVTTYKTEYVTQDIKFPTVTICPLNGKSISKLNKTIKDFNLTHDEFIRNIDKLTVNKVNFTDPKVEEIFQKLRKGNFTTYKDLLTSYQLTFKDMVEENHIMPALEVPPCKFYGRQCTKDDFAIVRTWFLESLCIQFNPYKGVGKSERPTPLSYLDGFQLFLDLNEEEEFGTVHNLHGVVVLIKSYGNPHQVLGDNEMVAISPGQYHFFKLSTRKFKLLPHPYESDCGERELEVIKKSYPYSQWICFVDCILSYAYQECGCVGFDIEELVDLEICPVEKMYCYEKARAKYQNEKREECWFQRCPRECTNVKYRLMKSSVALGNRRIYNNLERMPEWNYTLQQTKEYIRKNIVCIHVSFHDYSALVEIALPAVTWTTLFGSIGGSIGLCLGFSLITGFEFLFFIYDYITMPWKIKRRGEL